MGIETRATSAKLRSSGIEAPPHACWPPLAPLEPGLPSTVSGPPSWETARTVTSPGPGSTRASMSPGPVSTRATMSPGPAPARVLPLQAEALISPLASLAASLGHELPRQETYRHEVPLEEPGQCRSSRPPSPVTVASRWSGHRQVNVRRSARVLIISCQCRLSQQVASRSHLLDWSRSVPP